MLVTLWDIYNFAPIKHKNNSEKIIRLIYEGNYEDAIIELDYFANLGSSQWNKECRHYADKLKMVWAYDKR